MSTIVVGVDGSEESKRALGWAVEEAGYRGAELRVVYAYDYDPTWRQYAYAGEGMAGKQMDQIRDALERDAAQAREHAEAIVTTVAREVVGDAAPVTTVALQDHHPAKALVEQSRGADMLVVGSRGRGGFTGLVLGSVSQQCVHHAECPVVVIRSEH